MKEEPFEITISISDKSEEKRKQLFNEGIKYAFYLIKKSQEEKGILKPV
jgi:hypothetical protein